jgi:hypothetical protein
MIIANRPQESELSGIFATQRGRWMTYIAAFRCREGFVCCADTQETSGDTKQYVEKIACYGNDIEPLPYPFVIAGAGPGDLVDALAQEISERLLDERPGTDQNLRKSVKDAVSQVYCEDVPIMGLPRQNQSAHILIAVNISCSDSIFRLVWIRGKRVSLVTDGKAIVGYSTTANKVLLDRFHRPDLPMSQAVVLAAMMVAQSKYLDAYVGGRTSIATVTQFKASVEDEEFVALLESRANSFQPVVDDIFLHMTDVGLSKIEFERKLGVVVEILKLQRKMHIEQVAGYFKSLYSRGVLFGDWAYPKFPPGGTITFKEDGSVDATDDVETIPEHIQTGFKKLREQNETQRIPKPSDSEM